MILIPVNHYAPPSGIVHSEAISCRFPAIGILEICNLEAPGVRRWLRRLPKPCQERPDLAIPLLPAIVRATRSRSVPGD